MQSMNFYLRFNTDLWRSIEKKQFIHYYIESFTTKSMKRAKGKKV